MAEQSPKSRRRCELKTLTMALSPGSLLTNLLRTYLYHQLTPEAIKDAGLDYLKGVVTERSTGTVLGYRLMKSPKPDGEELREGDALIVEIATRSWFSQFHSCSEVPHHLAQCQCCLVWSCISTRRTERRKERLRLT